MEQLLVNIARGLVEDKDAVTVTADEKNNEGVIVYHLTVADGDKGRVIGKNGRIATAIRKITKAAASRTGEKVYVDIV